MSRERARTGRPREARLRPSPGFALQFDMAGRPFVSRDSEPYEQYWLSERDRLLWTLFGRRGGATTSDVVALYCRLARTPRSAAVLERLRRAVEAMHAAGVLVNERDELSRYSEAVTQHYLEHRPFPADLTAEIIRLAGIGADTRVLDIAGGPGDLALQLARTSQRVTLLELSRGFVASARRRARSAGLPLTVRHESANRLAVDDGSHDVMIVSQALHWLDDVMICKGVCRGLEADGHFIVVHSAFEVPDDHPLAFVLGHDSVFGARSRHAFAAEVEPIRRRISLLLEAISGSTVGRIGAGATADPVIPAGVSLFRQQRPMGVEFVRAFYTPAHLAAAGISPDAFWPKVERACAGRTQSELQGTSYWALLQFRRGVEDEPRASVRPQVRNIRFEPGSG